MNVNHKVSILIITSSILFNPITIADDIKNTVNLSFRYRLETVDQNGFIEDAKASTVRTRLTLKTDWTTLFDTVIEFDDVRTMGSDDYNSGAGTSPEKSNYPVIADPVGTEVNQAYVRYNGEVAKVALGRQRILIGNQRFVGGVGWRQNEQTYDGLTVNSQFKDAHLMYAYINNVNRIFGSDVPAGDHEHNTHLLNYDYSGLANGKLSLYYYSIDNEDAMVLSNDTLGIRYSGKFNSVSYTAEYATQSEGNDYPRSYDADYLLMEASYKYNNYSFGGGYELLGGDTGGGRGFTTSLATLHKFQGWADVFLATPAAGIEDVYINGSVTIKGVNIKLVYHDYSFDEASGASVGNEVDIAISTKITDNLTGLLKFASFDSDSDSYSSRDKIWLMFTYKL